MHTKMTATQPSLPRTDDLGRAPVIAEEGLQRERIPRAWWYAGLAWTLVRTDFKARYHGTLSGFVWALLKPIGMFVVLLVVFSFIFPDPTYKLQLIVGLFLWDFFAEGTKTGLASLHAKAFLFTKLRVPLWILVLTSIANPLITLAVFATGIVAFLALAGSPPTLVGLGLFLAYCGALTLTVVGFSLAASVLFLRYRDLNQVWDVLAQAGFFVAPIVYPLGIVPERFHFYFYLWPPTPIIEFSRAALVAHSMPSTTAHLYLALEVVAALMIGVFVMRRYGSRAAEYV
jgi:lipopolysaccharide transport system permease protein